MKIDLAKDLGINVNSLKKPEWTQDLISEHEIMNGVVITYDQRGRKHYIKILEIIALNFPIMSDEEQDNCILGYEELIKSIESSFHIKAVTTFTDIEEYVEKAKNAYYSEKNEDCREMIAKYINYLTAGGGLNTYKKHYYFIFELEPSEMRSINSDEEAISAIKRKTASIRNSFNSIGNEVLFAEEEDSGRIAELLYGYYNRNTASFESYNDRVVRIRDDRAKVAARIPDKDIPFDFRNLIAPKSIDFNESPNYMVIDGMYRSHFFIRGSSMPDYMLTQNGWLAGLMNLGYGYDVDMYFMRGEESKKEAGIKNTLKIANYTLSRSSPSRDNYDEVQESVASARWLKSAMHAGHQEPFELIVIITVWAFSLEELDFRRDELRKMARRLEVGVYECRRFQEEAFFSTGYNMDLRPKLFNVGKRNLTTDGVAAAFPFTSYNLADKGGIAVGINSQNRSLVIYNMFERNYANSNMFVCGQSGSGKTYLMMLLASRLRYLGTQCFIFASEKQDEYMRLTDNLGGVFVDLSSTSRHRINPLEIRPLSSPVNAFLGGESYEEKCWVIDKIDNVMILMNHLIHDLDQAENARIEMILVNLYKRFGMDMNNDSIYADKAAGKLKRMPTLQDLYNDIQESVKNGELRNEISIILQKFIEGSCRNMNGQTNIDLNNKFIVFGLEHIREEMLAPTMFIIMSFVWDKVRQDRTKRKVICFEEGWKLLEDGNEEVGKFVRRVFKLIRGFGGGAIFATQEPNDVSNSKAGKAIIANSHAKAILHMEHNNVKDIAELLGLTGKELAKVARQKPKRDALFCAGFNHIPIEVKAFKEEHEKFTTDAEELAKQAEEMRKNAGEE